MEDQDHRQPCLARIQQVPRIDKAIRQNRIDYESNEPKQHRSSDLFLRQPSGKTGKLGLERQQKSHDDGGSCRCKDMPLSDQNAESEGHQQGRGCGCFERALVDYVAKIHERQQYDDADESADNKCRPNQRRQHAQKACDCECADAEILVRPFALESDKQTDPE